VFLYAFDLLELNGRDMRREPLEVRKGTLLSSGQTICRRTLFPPRLQACLRGHREQAPRLALPLGPLP
jgi:ATP-dependent DNA ligase